MGRKTQDCKTQDAREEGEILKRKSLKVQKSESGREEELLRSVVAAARETPNTVSLRIFNRR
jgi:hypothetical protein